MSERQDSEADRVLRTIFANTNDVQGEWVSKRELYTHAVAHAGLKATDVDQALHQLRKQEKIDVDEGRYRPADGVERPKYQGESQLLFVWADVGEVVVRNVADHLSAVLLVY